MRKTTAQRMKKAQEIINQGGSVNAAAKASKLSFETVRRHLQTKPKKGPGKGNIGLTERPGLFVVIGNPQEVVNVVNMLRG